jgi:integrase/recombinase XerD
MKKDNFQILLQRYFLERLINQRNVSHCTISSYRDTFRLLLKYLKEEKKCAPDKLTIELISVENVIDFLKYLTVVRGNAISTVNNRLAAIHSFMDYVAYQNPEYLFIVQRVKAIPYKKNETKALEYLSALEVEAILNCCDLKTLPGRRDRIMIALFYNTGVRVTELLSVKISDITINQKATSTIQVLGKGRKNRIVPVWKTTASFLAEFIRETGKKDDDYLFTSSSGQQLSRSGAKYRLDCLVKSSLNACPSLKRKHITPHTFRHTTAMHLLQAGVDLSTIAIWLGHESIEATHKYMTADLQLKERALAQIREPEVVGFRYRPSNDILSFLDSL